MAAVRCGNYSYRKQHTPTHPSLAYCITVPTKNYASCTPHIPTVTSNYFFGFYAFFTFYSLRNRTKTDIIAYYRSRITDALQTISTQYIDIFHNYCIQQSPYNCITSLVSNDGRTQINVYSGYKHQNTPTRRGIILSRDKWG